MTVIAWTGRASKSESRAIEKPVDEEVVQAVRGAATTEEAWLMLTAERRAEANAALAEGYRVRERIDKGRKMITDLAERKPFNAAVPDEYVDLLADLYVELLEHTWAYDDAIGPKIQDSEIHKTTRLVGEIGPDMTTEAMHEAGNVLDAALGFGGADEQKEALRVYLRTAVDVRWRSVAALEAQGARS